MDGCESQNLPVATTVDVAMGQVLDDVESYLVGWVARLQRVLNQCHGAAQREAELANRIAAFDQQVQQWQAQRQQEMEQIHQGAEQLTFAWQRLETEQRQWLSHREPSPQHAAAPQPAAGASASSPLDQRVPQPTVVPRAVAAGPVESADGISRDAAVRQFEQLRREIGQHSRGNR